MILEFVRQQGGRKVRLDHIDDHPDVKILCLRFSFIHNCRSSSDSHMLPMHEWIEVLSLTVKSVLCL